MTHYRSLIFTHYGQLSCEADKNRFQNDRQVTNNFLCQPGDDDSIIVYFRLIGWSHDRVLGTP